MLNYLRTTIILNKIDLKINHNSLHQFYLRLIVVLAVELLIMKINELIRLKHSDSKGDLFLRLKIEVPTDLTGEEEKLVKKWQGLRQKK